MAFRTRSRAAGFFATALAVASAASSLTASCARAGVSADEVRIGVFEPLSGAFASGGVLEADGIRFAHEARPTLTVAGHIYRVVLVVADNKSDKVKAAGIAQRLVAGGVSAVLGSWDSSLSMAAGPVVRDAGIPALGLSCTNPLVTMGNAYYFRICFVDTFQGQALAGYAFSQRGARKAAVLVDLSSDYSVGLARLFSEAFVALAGDPGAIVSRLNYESGATDFSQQLSSIKALDPDVVFAPGNYTESARLIRQARAMGIAAPFLGGDSWETPGFLDAGGAALEGASFASAFAAEAPGGPRGEAFVASYVARHGVEPAAVTALGYDGYMLLLDAMERAGSVEPMAIRDALAATVDFEGVTGTISLGGDGDAFRPAVIKTVRDGGFRFLMSVQP